MGRTCCWTDKGEWLRDTFGETSPEYLDYEADRWIHHEGAGHTCLLPDGHEGEHEWTADGEIVIRVAPKLTDAQKAQNEVLN